MSSSGCRWGSRGARPGRSSRTAPEVAEVLDLPAEVADGPAQRQPPAEGRRVPLDGQGRHHPPLRGAHEVGAAASPPSSSQKASASALTSSTPSRTSRSRDRWWPRTRSPARGRLRQGRELRSLEVVEVERVAEVHVAVGVHDEVAVPRREPRPGRQAHHPLRLAHRAVEDAAVLPHGGPIAAREEEEDGEDGEAALGAHESPLRGASRRGGRADATRSAAPARLRGRLACVNGDQRWRRENRPDGCLRSVPAPAAVRLPGRACPYRVALRCVASGAAGLRAGSGASATRGTLRIRPHPISALQIDGLQGCPRHGGRALLPGRRQLASDRRIGRDAPATEGGRSPRRRQRASDRRTERMPPATEGGHYPQRASGLKALPRTQARKQGRLRASLQCG
jgi:hypothetical protein